MLTGLIALLVVPAASAGEISFTQQGRLLDDTGTPLNGTHRLDVSLHTDLENGSEEWHGTFDTVNFSEGYYMVTLTGTGTLGTDLDLVMAGGADLFLELHVDEDPSGPLTPRQPLSYVPAAAHASRAAGAMIVDVNVNSTGCSTPGGLAYDTSEETLYLCNGSAWFPAYTAERPPETFTYTGSDQTWIVPVGVTEVTISAWGAGGGAGRLAGIDGGAGGFAQGTVAVTPGQELTIVVGEGGARVTGGPSAAGKGGGLSGVFSGTPSQATALLVAGGGGGAGYYSSSNGGSHGGNGGGLNASDGSASDASYYDSRGRGATSSGGGAGGCYSGGWCGQNGTALQGGAGGNYSGYSSAAGTYGGGGGNGTSASYNSGGGGGGYWGGGGGSNNAPLGGGGGTGFVVATATNTALLTGTTVGEPPQTTHDLYQPGVALGGAVNGTPSGGPGLVVISP